MILVCEGASVDADFGALGHVPWSFLRPYWSLRA